MYSLSLDKTYAYRLLTDVHADGSAGRPYRMGCIVDTGCVNTLIDDVVLRYIRFIDLRFEQDIRIAGVSVMGKAVVLSRVDFGGLKADNVLVFAAPLIGTPVASRMLLGLSTLNNWNYEIKRTSNVIEFSESRVLPVGASARNKYTNYFNKQGEYVLLSRD